MGDCTILPRKNADTQVFQNGLNYGEFTFLQTDKRRQYRTGFQRRLGKFSLFALYKSDLLQND
jgi:hypothetical protein